MRRNLATVKAVVVDELHNLVESKRGVQLTVGLERLRKVAGDFQLVALSATVGSPQRDGPFHLRRGGAQSRQSAGPEGVQLQGGVPHAGLERQRDLQGDVQHHRPGRAAVADGRADRVAQVDARLRQQQDARRDARGEAEQARGDVGVHHGSLPREERERVENAFKGGQLRALVCTSTLELGIDIGSVDLVLQYMSPRQVTSLIQRVGRSGHDLQRTSEGSPDHRLGGRHPGVGRRRSRRPRKGRLEETRPYENSLDVLAHQIAGYLMDFESVEKRLVLAEVTESAPVQEPDGGGVPPGRRLPGAAPKAEGRTGRSW